jgi:hypothetical protein
MVGDGGLAGGRGRWALGVGVGRRAMAAGCGAGPMGVGDGGAGMGATGGPPDQALSAALATNPVTIATDTLARVPSR